MLLGKLQLSHGAWVLRDGQYPLTLKLPDATKFPASTALEVHRVLSRDGVGCFATPEKPGYQVIINLPSAPSWALQKYLLAGDYGIWRDDTRWLGPVVKR